MSECSSDEEGGVMLLPPSIASSEPGEKEEGLFENNGRVGPLPKVGRPAVVDSDQRPNRTIFTRSLNKSTTTEHLQLHFSQVGSVKSAVVVVDPKTGDSNGYGFVAFGDEDDATKAVEDMHGSMLNGHKIKVAMAKPKSKRGQAGEQDGSSRPADRMPGGVDFESKLIIRNLPWSVKDEKELTKLFLSYGKVLYANVPKEKTGKLRGFGIVILRGRKNAEKAKQALNGTKVGGRSVTVDWFVDKGGEDKAASGNVDDDDKSEEGDEDEEDEDEDEDEDEGDENDDDDDDEEENSEDENEDLSPTIFIRNLPFSCDDNALFEHFRQFGKLRYARVVVDPVTDRSRGTGFVCFFDPQEALACIKSAPRTSLPPMKSNETDRKKAGFQSLLQDEAVDGSGKYTLEGRILQLSSAVRRVEAGRLAEENSQKRSQRERDKRRVFLLREADIKTDSALGRQLSATDFKMRQASMDQRKKLLDTNPSLFVSLTRLSIRNLPRSTGSSGLKTLARQAVVGYATDVKAGSRMSITKDESTRDGDEGAEADRSRRERGKGIVKQAKIEFESRDGTKTREGEGGRSRGYGFIEYYTHRNALMALRWLNGRAIGATGSGETDGKENGGVNKGPRNRLVVEFALENAQVVQRRTRNEVASRERQDNGVVAAPIGGDGKGRFDGRPGNQAAGKRKRTATSGDGESENQADGKGRPVEGGADKTVVRKKPRRESAATTTDDPARNKLAARQQIIGRKRAQRRDRKGKA